MHACMHVVFLRLFIGLSKGKRSCFTHCAAQVKNEADEIGLRLDAVVKTCVNYEFFMT